MYFSYLEAIFIYDPLLEGIPLLLMVRFPLLVEDKLFTLKKSKIIADNICIPL